MEVLLSKQCIPCTIDTPPLEADEILQLKPQLNEAWKVLEDRQLERQFKFKDFATALEFVNKVGALAEEEGHHPDLELGWGRVVIRLMTHKIKGLSYNDFVMAAKIDQL
jgi:4a-hydroxytetrahydrobiopterin dehydratase